MKKIADIIEAAVGVIIVVFFCLTVVDDERIQAICRSDVTMMILDVLIFIAAVCVIIRIIITIVEYVNGK